MIYTVKFDIDFDGEEEVMSEKEIKNVLEELLDSTAITVRDFKLLDVNDWRRCEKWVKIAKAKFK